MYSSLRRLVAGGRVAAVAVVAATAVAACGSSSSSSSAGGASSSTGSASQAAATTTQSSGPVTLRIAYNPNPSNTPIVVAEKEGFFKQNGINAQLTTSQDTAALALDAGKQFDLVNTTPPTLLQAVAQGYKEELVASEDVESSSNRDTFLIGAKGITSLAALKGKVIGVPGLSGNLYESAVVALHKAGLSKSDVKFLIVPFPDMGNDLKSGTIQAAVTIVPFNGQLLGEGGVDLGNPIESTVNNQQALDLGWAASDSWVAANQATLQKFDKSQEEALAWMKSHQAATVKLLETDFQLPAIAAQHYPVVGYISYPTSAAYLTNWVAPMKAVGDLPSSFNPSASQLVYTP
ncbi:MAG TPA: ABC transporter substrate-binding protein [Solirubrobacteraceae bacterium]|nr:ABC transporter substrate-binding protein [Solirubrobacteraceae bacterium]